MVCNIICNINFPYYVIYYVSKYSVDDVKDMWQKDSFERTERSKWFGQRPKSEPPIGGELRGKISGDIRKLFENVVDKTDKKSLERNVNHKCWKQKDAAGRYD